MSRPQGARPLYEDRWLLVVEKPAGLPTQSPAGGGDNLFDRLRSERPYVGLHHRLDAGVSGAVLFTLDPAANPGIALLFQTHDLERTYQAVAAGEVAATRWSRPVEGKPARTDVEVVGRGGGRTALRLRPHTGRKHQLRIHAALAGAPLVGDREYGGEVGRDWPRIALHAGSLAFAHPLTQAPIRVAAPLPPDLVELWERSGGPSDR